MKNEGQIEEFEDLDGWKRNSLKNLVDSFAFKMVYRKSMPRNAQS